MKDPFRTATFGKGRDQKFQDSEQPQFAKIYARMSSPGKTKVNLHSALETELRGEVFFPFPESAIDPCKRIVQHGGIKNTILAKKFGTKIQKKLLCAFTAE